MILSKLLNWNCIWRVPICIKNLLKLQHNLGVVSSKTHTTCRIEVIPNKIAGSYVSSHIADRIFPVVHPRVIWILVSGFSSVSNRRSCLVKTRNHVVSNLHLNRTCVLHRGRGAKNIGVEQRPQVYISALNEMTPICY